MEEQVLITVGYNIKCCYRCYYYSKLNADRIGIYLLYMDYNGQSLLGALIGTGI